ncbi:hypothetical protein [Stackebrandtia nassauensis]|uniref:Lipoprotein n=1 Tax=Stackebrandtia nassauensis (strain DSM 44728 / CIP 108903 / NRRL B-16338 / NBRC 102104 / LLR-40K-21) TaxID=446470 RepID=D3Q321_STANL|nr:hypothetical protein [Stackebrandtia nassauensis]ADD39991.1 hypothetical protein Snas_0273 [Stackebrandtia nassauensis DSM 44728]
MKLLTGTLLAGAACLSVLAGCSSPEAKDDSSKSDSSLAKFTGSWQNEEAGTELTVKDSGKVTLTGWGEESTLTSELTADKTDGVAAFDVDGSDKTPFHFVVEFRNSESDQIYLDDTNETDVPPLEMTRQD